MLMKNDKIAMAVLFFCILALIAWAAWKVSSGSAAGQQERQSQGVEIAQGEPVRIEESKSEEYGKARNGSIQNSAEKIWSQMQETIETSPAVPSQEDARSEDRRSINEQKAMSALLGEDAPAVKSEPAAPSRSGGGGGGGARRAPASASKRPAEMTQQEKDEKLRHDYELATEIARRMYGLEGEQTPQDASSAAGAAQTGASEEPPRTVAVDTWGGGSGISSLDEPAQMADDFDGLRPVKCMFIRDEKVKSGQRVTLRLLEDVVIGGVLIPRDSHLSALCSIKDRLYLSVSSIELNGRICQVALDVYDSDGTLGVYCPDVDNSAARTARDEALNIGQTAVRGSIGSVASSILRTGAGLIRSASGGTPSVTVPSGYTVFLMKTQRR